MKKSEQYLEKLRHDMEVWRKKVDEIPDDRVSVNHPAYKMYVNAINKYYAAAYMMKLMKEED